jgi:hypothetical protein
VKSGFRYSLEALLKKRRLDKDVVKAEELAARAVVEAKRKEVDGVRAAIAAAEQQLREAMVPGAEIDREGRDVLAAYSKDQHEILKKLQLELERAEKVHEDIRRNFEIIFKDVKTLERHRDNRKTEFVAESERSAQHRADELWLMRTGRDAPKTEDDKG